jgi:hypothetical protein
MKKKYTTIENNEMLAGHNGFKRVNMNDQARKKVDNPLVSVARAQASKLPKNKYNLLEVKGRKSPEAKNEAADGHLGRGSDAKAKETPHFPLRRPNDDVE